MRNERLGAESDKGSVGVEEGLQKSYADVTKKTGKAKLEEVESELRVVGAVVDETADDDGGE